MKRFALALVLVLAFSTAAMAIDFTTATINVIGSEKYVNGVKNSSVDTDARVLKLSVAGEGWKGMMEFANSTLTVLDKDGATTTTYIVPTFVLDDWYFQTKEGAFLYEMWGKGEDQNADKTTPFGWINETDDAPATWEARVSGPVANIPAVFAVEDGAAPIYYAFVEPKFGTATVGVGYNTNFVATNTLDGWVTNDMGTVVLTGEVARVNAAKMYVGAKAVFDNGINAQAYMKDKDETYLEAYSDIKGMAWFKGSYKKAGATTTLYADARLRGSYEQTAADIFNVDNDLWDLADSADNDWQKNKTWTVGGSINSVDNSVTVVNTLKVAGSYKPMAKAVLFGSLTSVGGSNTIEARVRYDATPKLAIVPVAVLGANGMSKISAHADLVINKGHLIAGYTNSKASSVAKADNIIEFGYNLSF